MNIKFIALFALVAASLFVAQDALANSEDQVIGIIERVLNVIAEFLDKVFQSIADAVKSVWTPSDKDK